MWLRTPMDQDAANAREPGIPLMSEPSPRRKPRRGRMTLAFLADYLTHFAGSYELKFRKLFASQCQALDINLLLVYGGALDYPHPDSISQNAIYDLLHPETVDGVLLLSTNLASYSGPSKVRELVSKLHGIPCCSVGIALDGVPSVVIDNNASMEAVVEHLITAHGRRRIAFLAGTPDNPESQARHAAYCRVLERHELTIDPALFAYGYFWGRRAEEGLQQILSRGHDFDALVCANDTMAQVAIARLSALGRRVPRDVSVTGFDDLADSKLMNPPMTTAAQPFEAMAERAIQLVMDQIAGRAVPLASEMRAELVVRQSCGCGRQNPRFRSPETLTLEMHAIQHLRDCAERLSGQLQESLCIIPGCEHDGAERIVFALNAELSGRPGAFLDCMGEIAEAASHNPDCLPALQRIIVYLRRELRSFSSEGLEDLWHEARDCIELAIARGGIHQRVRVEDGYLRLLETSEEVSRALDRSSFRASLSRILPLIKITSGAISQYTAEDRDQLELVAGLLDQTLREDTATRFPARQLMPASTYPDGRRHTSLVLPLVLETKRLGIAVFEYNGDAIGQLMVRTQISAALSSIHLHQEIIEKTMQHERSLQERAATTKRMDALSVLAGGVAHDLNNSLGPLVALPDVILGDLEAAVSGGDVTELRRDIETVKSSALRAAQTIKDLLTLGRQGRTTKEPLDLVQVVASCMTSDLLRIVRSVNPQVELRIDVAEEPLVIHASEAHVVRAVTNLVHNAAEAITGAGEVAVQVHAVNLANSLHGFESIEPGSYGVVTVKDSGRGMAAQDLHRVFEPFFSKKRTIDHSGSGLGLAIVHGVVKEHDGFIDVVSSPGAGTCFRLYFPRAEVQVQLKVRSDAPAKCGHGSILIVDDEPVQLRTGRRVLSRLGYQVDVLDSGQAAHERFLQAAQTGRSPYDLVLLDMILNEELDGLERFEQIRQLFPDQRAIVVSGHAPPERAEAAFRKGLAWLAKPYTADALVGAVQTALAEQPGIPAQKISCKPPHAEPKTRPND